MKKAALLALVSFSALLLFIGQADFGGARGDRSLIREARAVEAAPKDPTIRGMSGRGQVDQASGKSDLLNSHVSLMEKITGKRFVQGNRVELLVNGPAAFDAMFGAVQRASDHINAEFYIVRDDEIGQQFARVFLQKQAAGVQVNLIYDSLGSKDTSVQFFDRLREGGVNVIEFNPINPVKSRGNAKITNRNHRKLLIVDGAVAFTGGMNIGTEYSESPSGDVTGRRAKPEEMGWQDTMVQIEGPVVSQFQRLFLDNWHSQNGPGLSGNNYFPRVAEAGTDLVMAVGSSSRDSYRAQYTMYLSAFKSATRSLYVTNSYFVPDHRVIESLTGAAGRGVDVRLILPSKSDHFLVLKAGKSTYGTLLASGVRIYELRGSLLHAKTAVIDGIWSTVGSTNIEPWSFRANDEINALVLGEGFGREMERLFEDDLKQSDEVTLDQWLGQSYLDRLLRFFAGLLFRWLTIIHGALS